MCVYTIAYELLQPSLRLVLGVEMSSKRKVNACIIPGKMAVSG